MLEALHSDLPDLPLRLVLPVEVEGKHLPYLALFSQAFHVACVTSLAFSKLLHDSVAGANQDLPSGITIITAIPHLLYMEDMDQAMAMVVEESASCHHSESL